MAFPWTAFHAWLWASLFLLTSSLSHRVQVRREIHLPTLSTPSEARKAWLDFVWENGGGLPLLRVIPISTQTETDDYLETSLRQRMLLPIGMQEELITKKTISAGHEQQSELSETTQIIHYRVTKSGLLCSEIVSGSHSGWVSFEADKEIGTRLTWNVSFNTTTTSRAFIWQAVTEQTIGDSCRNLQAAFANPIQYQRVTFLRYPNNSNVMQVSVDQAMEDWIAFCWNQGGGLPTPLPPLRFQEDRWIIPPFLHERITTREIKRDDQGIPILATLRYTVVNPGWFTYQVFSHQGKITFQHDEPSDSIRMDWVIEVRPYPALSEFVQSFTSAVVSVYARNFKDHVGRGGSTNDHVVPDAHSALEFLHRIGWNQDSWIGGVLEAFQADNRPIPSRVVDAFRPWTWGRGSNFDEEGEFESWNHVEE